MRETFQFASCDDYVPKAFNLKWNQNATGEYNGIHFTTTMTQLTLKNGKIEYTVAVNKAKDFDFEALFACAYPEFNRLVKNRDRSDEREFKLNFKHKNKKERKRPQY